MLNIDKVMCLCLDRREKEWMRLKNECENIGLEFEPFIAGDGTHYHKHWYDQIDNPCPDISGWGYGRDGFKHHHWNAFQCHKKMFQNAIDQNLENVLILEDDAYITSRFIPVWDTVKNNLPDDYGIIYLGWWIGDENDEWNLGAELQFQDQGIVELEEAKQIGGLHGALVHKRMFKFLMSLPPNNPIDYQLNLYHKQLPTYFLSPKIIHTKTMYSVCEGSVITRNTL